MLSNRDVQKYIRDNTHGAWQNYLSMDEIMDVHGAPAEFRKVAAEMNQTVLTRKEVISNLAGHEVVWLDGLNAISQALLFLSPAVPTCKQVHINLTPELLPALDTLKARYDKGDFADWNTALSVHSVARNDLAELEEVVPERLDMASVLSREANQEYVQSLIEHLRPGGVLWIDAAMAGGQPLYLPSGELAQLNRWIAAHRDLTTIMVADGVGYSLSRKNT